MKKIIKLKESDLHRIVKRVLTEQEYPDPIKYSAVGGTNTSSAGAYVTPGGITWSGKDKPSRRTYTYDDPYYPEGGYDPDDPYDPPGRKKYPKSGSYETKIGRSPMCCKKCKNGRFKHQCDNSQAGGGTKYDSTNCVYATISDCQLNKRNQPGNISNKKKKSKK